MIDLLIYLIVIMCFVTLFLITYSVLKYIYRDKQRVSERLYRIAKEESKDQNNELNQPIFIRLIRPIMNDISKTIVKVTPKEVINNFEKKVIMSGNPFNLMVNDWINIQVAILLCFPLLTIVLGNIKAVEIRNIVFFIFVEIGIGLLLPNIILSKSMTDRQKKITNSMPDVIDLLTVSIEAGLGFDSALAKVVDKMPGPLADEFDIVLQEIKVGKQKRDALRDMSERVGIQDLTTFVSSIVQADQLGVSIGNVIKIQSEQMRQRRRQRAQEKAMKAPVKMLIPMVLFIFPTIFSVLLGPVIIKMIDAFAK